MKHMIIISALFAALGLTACDREPAVVYTPPAAVVSGPQGPPGAPGATSVVPVPVPVPVRGPAGATGATGATGNDGPPGESTTVVVTP